MGDLTSACVESWLSARLWILVAKGWPSCVSSDFDRGGCTSVQCEQSEGVNKPLNAHAPVMTPLSTVISPAVLVNDAAPTQIWMAILLRWIFSIHHDECLFRAQAQPDTAAHTASVCALCVGFCLSWIELAIMTREYGRFTCWQYRFLIKQWSIFPASNDINKLLYAYFDIDSFLSFIIINAYQ